jgi:DNA-binding XRE family transcriptional regulator
MQPLAEPQVALGRAVRRLREERELSQEALAHLAGVHTTSVVRLENGRLNPSWGIVSRIACALELTVSELAEVAERGV